MTRSLTVSGVGLLKLHINILKNLIMIKELNTNSMKLISGATIAAVALTLAPMAFADTVSVSNNNSADVSNDITVTARTSGNTSRGARGDSGGDGGAVDAQDGGGEATAGRGGRGGAGGHGGDITTGDAIATAEVSNDVNTSDTEVIDNGTDENQYDEFLQERTRIGASYEAESESAVSDNWDVDASSEADGSTEYDSAEGSQSEASNSSSVDADASESYDEEIEYDQASNESAAESESSSDNNNSSSDSSASNESSAEEASGSSDISADSSASVEAEQEASQSESEYDNESGSADYSQSTDYSESTSYDASMSASESGEVHDDYDLEYRRTYVASNDRVAVENTNDATVGNTGAVAASTGDNTTTGGRGDAGGEGGDADTDQTNNNSEATAGDAGAGGRGGNGGAVRTGVSDSLALITNVSNRTTTRVVRN
jgi:hypothetical protein